MFFYFLRLYIHGYNMKVTKDVTEERRAKMKALTAMSEESILNAKQDTSPTTRRIPWKGPERA